jgi:hypothetical protein
VLSVDGTKSVSNLPLAESTSDVASPKATLPVIFKLVKVPAAGVVAPMVAPSIVPAIIAAVASSAFIFIKLESSSVFVSGEPLPARVVIFAIE